MYGIYLEFIYLFICLLQLKSDFGGSDTEEDEVFLTPCESPSRLSLSDDTDDDSNKIFIYG